MLPPLRTLEGGAPPLPQGGPPAAAGHGEQDRAHHALRGEAQPRLDARSRDAAAMAAGRQDPESLQGRGGTGCEASVDGVQERGQRQPPRRIEAVPEDELRQWGPDVAPAAGQHAGARGGVGGAEADQDLVQQRVGEAADAVLLAGAGTAAAAAAAFAVD